MNVFEKSVDTFRHFVETHNVTFSMTYDPQLPRFISCDSGRLRQITLNLLPNAIKFSNRPAVGPRGQVSLIVKLGEEGFLELTVADNGIGIAPEFLDHPFEQSAEVRRHEFGGSGLWLSIVSQLAEKLNGSISVESQPGRVSTFTVQLPIVEPKGHIHLVDLSGLTVACLQSAYDGVTYFQDFFENCELMLNADHRAHKGLNNRIEGSHRPTRRREKVMGRFKSPRQAQQFLAAHNQINIIFKPRRYRLTVISYRHVRADAFSLWADYDQETPA